MSPSSQPSTILWGKQIYISSGGEGRGGSGVMLWMNILYKPFQVFKCWWGQYDIVINVINEYDIEEFSSVYLY